MPPQDPGQRRPIPTRVKIIITCIMLALSAGAIRLAVFVGKKEGFDPEKWDKPFGLGVGPSYIGGSDTVFEGDSLVFQLYADFRRYNKLTGKTSNEVEEYYKRWLVPDQCLGGCGDHAVCMDGVCVCDGENEYVQLFGRCLSNSTAFLKQESSDLKYRKPTPPPIPDECYKEVSRGEGRGKETILDPKKAHMPGCQRITYPDEFDETSLECGRSDHVQCQLSDTNMFCTPEGRCVCRQDMAFNRGKMECQLLLDVDCTQETGYDFVTEGDQEMLEVVTGNKDVEKGTTLDEAKAKKAFCVYLDGKAETYNELRQGEYDLIIWGLNLMGFILLIFALLICFSTLCFCFFYIKDFLHFLDPRNAMAAITAQQEMTAVA